MRVAFIVRVEKLWQDRDQVRVAELYRPGARVEPWPTGTPWNHRIEITQGGACGVHHGEAQGEVPPALVPDAPPSVMEPEGLAAGFIVLSTALDNSYHDCDLALQTESLVIAKEHIVDEYGPIGYTIGNGCSGGVYYQTPFRDTSTTAENYPRSAAWTVAFAQNLTATTAGSGFSITTPTPVVHTGGVCLQGVTCTGNRDLFDDFGVAASPTTGLASIIYSDDQFSTKGPNESFCGPSDNNTINCDHTSIATQTGGSGIFTTKVKGKP